MTAEHDVPDIDVTDGDEPTATGTEPDAIETQEPTKPKRGLAGRLRRAARRNWAAIALAVGARRRPRA